MDPSPTPPVEPVEAPGLPLALLDLLLPRSCAGCDAQGTGWCTRCRRAFDRSGLLELPGLPGLPPVVALAAYRGAARAAVLAYKERGRRDLARPLACSLRRALVRHGLPALPVVPAPSRRGAARVRGGDHVLRLARALVAGTYAGTDAGGVARALVLTVGARDSVGLDPATRAANLAAHLRLRRRGLPPPGRPVLLLDDVLTTGATASAASTLLAAAGHPVAAVVVLTAAGGHPISRVGAP